MAKNSLGRGLGALMGEANAEVSAITSDNLIPIKNIVVNKNQPRKLFNEDELEELGDSIKQNGILQPILVREIKNNKYEIVAGERRFQAAKRAKLEEVPVIIKDISDKDVFKIALIENLQRSDLSAIEEAKGYKQLIQEENLTQEELAQVLSKSRSAIANTMRLLDLPEQVQTYLEEGRLTAGHARALLSMKNEENQLSLAEKIISDGLTVRETERIVPLFSVNNTVKRERQVQPQYFKRAAHTLRLALDTNVKIKSVRGKNKIEIEFKDETDLKEIIERLNH